MFSFRNVENTPSLTRPLCFNFQRGDSCSKNRLNLSPSLVKCERFYCQRGPLRQPGKCGKRALCIEEGGQQRVAATQQQESPGASKIVADSYVPGVLRTFF
jgi:hypothetical protein